MYGVDAGSEDPIEISQTSVEVVSQDRQDPEDLTDVHPSAPSQQHILQVEDHSLVTMRREYANAPTQYATMVAGPRGFLHAFFDAEGPIETEMPNLLLAAKEKGKETSEKRAAAEAAQAEREASKELAAEQGVETDDAA